MKLKLNKKINKKYFYSKSKTILMKNVIKTWYKGVKSDNSIYCFLARWSRSHDEIKYEIKQNLQ